jgi:hypothetical protein
METIAAAFGRLVKAAEGLAGVIEGTSYGTPALKAGKKLLCRVKDAETLVLICPMEDKALLMEAAPDIYYETDHYRGWPAILIRIDRISDEELAHRLKLALQQATPRKPRT